MIGTWAGWMASAPEKPIARGELHGRGERGEVAKLGERPGQTVSWQAGGPGGDDDASGRQGKAAGGRDHQVGGGGSRCRRRVPQAAIGAGDLGGGDDSRRRLDEADERGRPADPAGLRPAASRQATASPIRAGLSTFGNRIVRTPYATARSISSAPPSARLSVRTQTVVPPAARRPARSGRSRRAFDLSAGATASSRSRITTSAPLAAAFAR